MVKHDVTHPQYYAGQRGDLIDHWYDRFGTDADVIMVANVEKYVERYREKNGLEDLRKAAVYLDRLTQKVERRERDNNMEVSG